MKVYLFSFTSLRAKAYIVHVSDDKVTGFAGIYLIQITIVVSIEVQRAVHTPTLFILLIKYLPLPKSTNSPHTIKPSFKAETVVHRPAIFFSTFR